MPRRPVKSNNAIPPMASSVDSIAQWRVTPDNPPRDIDGLDFERCAALHNFLVIHAWTSYGRPIEELGHGSWWATHGDSAEAIRSRLHPSLVEFLQRAYELPWESQLSVFTYLAGLNVPPNFWLTPYFGGGAGAGRFLTLYTTHAELASPPDGLVYDQADHTVHLNLSLACMPAGDDVGALGWMKLEAVLSIYVDMVARGKAVALPRRMYGCPSAAQLDADPATGARAPHVDFARPWVVVPYARPLDVDDTLAIWHDLVGEIERRMPGPGPGGDGGDQEEEEEAVSPPAYGLVDAAHLDAAGVPPTGFAREVLSRARRPRFAYMAPGLRLPTAAEFVAQPYRAADFGEDPAAFIPPIRLFVLDGQQQQQQQQQQGPASSSSGHPEAGAAGVVAEEEERMPCGFFLEQCHKHDAAPFEDATFVRFPFRLARRPDDSERSEPGVWEMAWLQVEAYGKDHGAQLLAVLENMYINVTAGHWQVDENGVAGGIEVFRDADVDELEQWYHIPIGPGRFW